MSSIWAGAVHFLIVFLGEPFVAWARCFSYYFEGTNVMGMQLQGNGKQQWAANERVSKCLAELDKASNIFLQKARLNLRMANLPAR